MTPRANRRLFLTALAATVGFTALALLVTYLLGVEYGVTLFTLVPFLAGYIAGRNAETYAAGVFVLLASWLVCAVALLAVGIEGIVCIGMATPLIIAFGFLGAWIAQHLPPKKGGGAAGSTISLVVAVLLVGCSGAIERPLSSSADHVAVTTRDVRAAPEKVWAALLAFQRVEGRKPFLLHVGLPVPMYCTIEGSGVGAVRTCHFNNGVIEERISVWSPPVKLGMEITRVTLPGRDWLKFVDASYRLERMSESVTRVHRITRHTSVLRPRVYWSLLEDLGMQAEHEFLFNALERKLEEPPA